MFLNRFAKLGPHTKQVELFLQKAGYARKPGLMYIIGVTQGFLKGAKGCAGTCIKIEFITVLNFKW